MSSGPLLTSQTGAPARSCSWLSTWRGSETGHACHAGPVPVRPGEHGPHRGARIPADLQHVQAPLLISQLTGQIGEGRGR
ncbi:MAG TPA: hypothetical protein VMK13_08245, partial [Streptosporangiaceae bacterium]|nr:hypothetical protein [Streptosporangiaceae bacterium]